MDDLRIQKYFERLNLTDISCNYIGLKTIQIKHMLKIPFENLDVVVGRDIDLNIDHLFNKLIERKRGGYCFELNILHSFLLSSVGFKVKPVLGRVWLRDQESLPPRNHLTHLVYVEDTTFVTDVGFGGLAPKIPLDIHFDGEVNDGDGIVRVKNFNWNQFMVQRKVGDRWINQFSFEDVSISDEDINIANFFMSKNKSSHFFNKRFVAQFTDAGRIGLFENTFTERVGCEIVNTITIGSYQEWHERLKSDFKLHLDFSDNELCMLKVK